VDDLRGRVDLQTHRVNGESTKIRQSPSKRATSPQGCSSGSGDSVARHKRNLPKSRRSFTRSRSPAVISTKSTNVSLPSPTFSYFHLSPAIRNILPEALQIRIYVLFTRTSWTLYIDTRKAAECFLLLGSLLYSTTQLMQSSRTKSQPDSWIFIGEFHSV
jgi:hypothetical protein